MRIFVFLLLALNVLIFIGHFWEDAPIEEEKPDDTFLKIIAEKDLPENSTVNDKKFSKIEEVKTPTATTAPVEKEKQEEAPKENIANSFALPNKENKNNSAPMNSNCLFWNNLNSEEALQLQKMLVQRFGHLSAEVSSKKNGKWRIFIPPFPDSDSARLRARSLKELDLDYFVLSSGENKNSISLGVFAQEKTARQYFEELQQKGVNDAVLQFKPTNAEANKTQIKIMVQNEEERTRLTESAQKLLGNKPPEQCK